MSNLTHTTPLDAAIADLLAESGPMFMTSSFGAEAVLLIDAVYRVRPLPVVFVDTGFHFPETLNYVDELCRRYDLDLRVARPHPETVAAYRSCDGRSDASRSESCCRACKLEPLHDYLWQTFRHWGWLSGVRRDQTDQRRQKPNREYVASLEITKIYPLLEYGFSDVLSEIEAKDLPKHPLLAQGFYAIGCEPCTGPSSQADPRSGRWAAQGRTECGLHTSAFEFVRRFRDSA